MVNLSNNRNLDLELKSGSDKMEWLRQLTWFLKEVMCSPLMSWPSVVGLGYLLHQYFSTLKHEEDKTVLA